MGNGKLSTGKSSSVNIVTQTQRQKLMNLKQLRRRNSDPNDYADVQLGRLRSIDFRLGNVLLQSDPSCRTDGLLLDRLWSPSTFVFSRTCDKHHNGFGFSCDISFRKENGAPDGLYVVSQMAKPKAKRTVPGMEDTPLDVFDVNPQIQRQVLGLVIKKLEAGKSATILEGITIFSIQGVLGHIIIKDDWTSCYEFQNNEGEVILTAKRFNRISGGIEFQIYSETENDVPIILATLVRLEEAKFILKLYTPAIPAFKAIMISFTLFLMYLMSR